MLHWVSVLHYERDRAQGNVTRFLVKGGLLGLDLWIIWRGMVVIVKGGEH